MSSVTAFEAKTHFGDLLARVSRGEEIVITKYERPVARLIPEGRPDLSQVREGVRILQELRAEMRKQRRKPLSDKAIRSARDDGRR